MSDNFGKEAQDTRCDLTPRYKNLLAEIRLASNKPELEQNELAGIETYLLFLQVAAQGLGGCQAFLDQFALSEGKLSVLLLLKNTPHQSLTPSEIADGACVTRGTITGLLAGLERDGYIVREEDPRDGRKAVIMLTRRAKEAIQKLMTERFTHIQDTISGFTPEEMRQLRALLEKLNYMRI